jgi:hypothetical protein
MYVADIEKYTIMVTHTYKRAYIEGNSNQIQGYLMECEKKTSEDKMNRRWRQGSEMLVGRGSCEGKRVKRPIECITGTCPFLPKKKRGHTFLQRADEAVDQVVSDAPVTPREHHHWRPGRQKQAVGQTAFSSVMAVQDADRDAVNPAELAAGGFFAIPQGDIFRIDKLLELSGTSLDHSFNAEGEPLREAGTVIEITVSYSNLHPFLSSFGVGDVHYFYKVSRRPMDEMKTELLAESQPDYPRKRIIEDRHGLFLVVRITGEFGFFSIVYLLIMLTTAVALTGVAIKITDLLAVYVMKEKNVYRRAKYELTNRMNEDRQDMESSCDEFEVVQSEVFEDGKGNSFTRETSCSKESKEGEDVHPSRMHDGHRPLHDRPDALRKKQDSHHWLFGKEVTVVAKDEKGGYV